MDEQRFRSLRGLSGTEAAQTIMRRIRKPDPSHFFHLRIKNAGMPVCSFFRAYANGSQREGGWTVDKSEDNLYCFTVICYPEQVRPAGCRTRLIDRTKCE